MVCMPWTPALAASWRATRSPTKVRSPDMHEESLSKNTKGATMFWLLQPLIAWGGLFTWPLVCLYTSRHGVSLSSVVAITATHTLLSSLPRIAALRKRYAEWARGSVQDVLLLTETPEGITTTKSIFLPDAPQVAHAGCAPMVYMVSPHGIFSVAATLVAGQRLRSCHGRLHGLGDKILARMSPFVGACSGLHEATV